MNPASPPLAPSNVAPYLLAVLDAEGRLQKSNAAWRHALGFTQDELAGRPLADLVHPDDVGALRAALEQASEADPASPAELRYRARDGSYHKLLCEASSAQAGLFWIGRPAPREVAPVEGGLLERGPVLNLLAKHAPVSVAMFDREMRYLVATERWIQDHELEEQDVIGQSHYEVVPNFPEHWREVHQRALAGETVSSDEDPYEHEDGTVTWFRWVIEPWYGVDGEIGGVVLLIENIDERKASERALLETRTRQEAILDAIPDLMFRLSRDGVYLDFHAADPAQLAVPADQLIGTHIEEMMPEALAQEALRAIGRALETGEVQVFEYELPLPHGDVHDYEARIAPSGSDEALVIVRDITERKRAERSLQHQEERMRLLYQTAAKPARDTGEHLDEAIALAMRLLGLDVGLVCERNRPGASFTLRNTAGSDGRFQPGALVLSDQAYCAITMAGPGITAVEEMGASEHRDHAGYAALEMEAYLGATLVVQGRPYGTLAFLGRAPRAEPFTAADREFVALLARWVASTIERELTEQQLREARDAAEAASETKSRFLATMSHEIRTPLNGIIGFAEVLRATPLSPDQRDHLDIITSSGETLLALINDILDLSKIEAKGIDVEYRPVDVRGCVEGALDVVASAAAEKQLELAYRIGNRVPVTILGDPVRLRQVLTNLVSNAVKFTACGEVVVSLDAEPLFLEDTEPAAGARRSLVPVLADAPAPSARYRLKLTVSDSGIGMEREQLPRLFDPFYQVDDSSTRQHGGTGLGLAITKQLVELMGGQIWAESAPGQGSAFHVVLGVEATESVRRVYVSKGAAKLEGRYALVVDDLGTNRRLLALQLQEWGVRTQSVESGEEALALLQQGLHFDVALLDMDMPGMNGAELARQMHAAMRKTGRQLPLVLLSSSVVPEAADGDLFASVLMKPVRQRQLQEVLLEALREDAPAPPPVASDAGETSEVPPLRVLVAEDDATNQRLISLMLGPKGHALDVVSDGVEALEAIERQPYDVVLMDIRMPHMDGLEATRRVRARRDRPQPYIIAVTANAMAGDRDRYLRAGANDYVSKPVSEKALAAAFERVTQDRGGRAA